MLRACNHQTSKTYASFTTKQGMVHLVGHTLIIASQGAAAEAACYERVNISVTESVQTAKADITTDIWHLD
jgi:hypothetical protein